MHPPAKTILSGLKNVDQVFKHRKRRGLSELRRKNDFDTNKKDIQDLFLLVQMPSCLAFTTTKQRLSPTWRYANSRTALNIYQITL